MIKTKKQMFIVIGAFLLTILLGTVTYAFFNYTRTGSSNVIKVGRIAFNSTQGNSINLTNMFPIDVSSGVPNDATKVGSVTINITGDTTYEEGVEYLVSAVNVQNTVGTKSLPISIDVSVSSNTNNDPATTLGTSDDSYFTNRGTSATNSIYKVLAKDTISTNDQLVVGYIKSGSTGVDGNIVIRAYLDKDKIGISDTYDGNETDNMGTTNEWAEDRTILTTTEWNSLQTNGVSFQIKVEANEGIWVEEPLTGTQMIQRAIVAKQNATTNSCNPVFIDDNGTASDESDDITYFSGDNDCVDMNYVWYSGKLWRITAIYPDGTMKLVTEDNITAISWGSSSEYDGSWVYQWLNEDFYDTLYNANNIIENGTWNYSTDENSTPVRPKTIETQKTKTAPVGLLNAYEYYNSYRCIGSSACTGSSYSTGYLNIGYYWWLITPYSASDVRYVDYDGYLSDSSPSSNAFGVRPSINLKSGLEFTGDGSKSNPYKIKEDKEDAVNNTTLLSSRSIGEYVEFDNDLYRIVDTTNGITKLTKVDYLRESGTVIEKNLSSTVYFGRSTNTGSDTYWDYYLNNTWYNSISSTYKNMLVDGTYYLGLYGGNTNYKATICKDADLNSITMSSCTKYTSSDTDKTFIGKVGLPRVGEMFSSQLGTGYSTSGLMWLITPYSASYVRGVYINGDLFNTSPLSDACGVRPSINLKSGIKITGGTGYVGGDTNSPFEISE